MFRRGAAILGLAALVGSTGLAQASREWPTWPVADAPAELRPLIQRGDLLIVSLHSALQSELGRALAGREPADALGACHIDTAAAAYRLARRDGVAAGRTAARLRNPANAPRPWAAALVARHPDARASAVDGYVVDLGDRIGLLRPIAEQEVCGSCHGPAATLAAGVRSRLTGRYPADRAVGFRDGDLRGWFWLEIPKR